MKYYIDDNGLLMKVEAFYIGLVGFGDLIKELDEVREAYQEVQDRFENEGHIYRQDLRDMLDKLVEFNQNFKNTYESLLGKIE